ncbi:hypothetical protein [Halobacteriovorax sp. HLS]|uniref:hypothetical protein n=1 Tax=Halobacteriovorax sp. HLS TaxID=2234000 RepID=UPI000FD7E820|nr:hypothetical protein [Halobacteriovorax sp. HLS]
MTNTIYDLLMITSFDPDSLIEEYRVFFLSLLPGMFIFACLIEYFDRMNVFELVKRALVAVIIMASVTSFYKVSIRYSIDAANTKFEQQKGSNILLMDMFEASSYFDKIDKNKKDRFFKDNTLFKGTLKFVKYHFFDSFINDGFTIGVYFLSQLCFILLKVVYSLVYYLGYGLVGIPVLIYLFPTMGNVLRGGILSYLWCLIVPHVLVFVLSMIGSEINRGYQVGQIIGGSATGTILLFTLTLFIAFTPFITMMLINGSGIAQAGGIISLMGGNFIKSLPSKGVNAGATVLTGGALGPKSTIAKNIVGFGAGTAMKGLSGAGNQFKSALSNLRSSFSNSSNNTVSPQSHSSSSSNSNTNSSSSSGMSSKFRSSNQTQVREGGNNVKQQEIKTRSRETNKSGTNNRQSEKTNNNYRTSRSNSKSQPVRTRNHGAQARRRKGKL